MSAPRRWVDDSEADQGVREVLRGAPAARSLDAVTRRRLSVKVARASAVPAVTAGWLFVKSAAAALAVVLGTGAIAVSTGVIDWSPSRPVGSGPPNPKKVSVASSAMPTLERAPEPVVEPEVKFDGTPKLNPAPSLPVTSPSTSSSAAGTLSAEAALLEQARRQMRSAPAVALAIAAEHAQRFARGQLGSERTLIQIEALHRLNRDPDARVLARGLLSGAGSGLYAERVHQLLGEDFEP